MLLLISLFDRIWPQLRPLGSLRCITRDVSLPSTGSLVVLCLVRSTCSQKSQRLAFVNRIPIPLPRIEPTSLALQGRLFTTGTASRVPGNQGILSKRWRKGHRCHELTKKTRVCVSRVLWMLQLASAHVGCLGQFPSTAWKEQPGFS